MFCSNCRVIIEIEAGTMELPNCKNGHCFCVKCTQSNGKCLICEGEISNRYPWICLQECCETCNGKQTKINDFEVISNDMSAFKEDCHAESTHFLYSNQEAYDVESPKYNDSDSSSVSTSDHTTKMQDHILMGYRVKPMRFVKAACIEDGSVVARKDQRQEMLDQTRKEVTKQIVSEIVSSHKIDLNCCNMYPDVYGLTKKYHIVGVSTDYELIPEEQSISCASAPHSKDTIMQLANSSQSISCASPTHSKESIMRLTNSSQSISCASPTHSKESIIRLTNSSQNISCALPTHFKESIMRLTNSSQNISCASQTHSEESIMRLTNSSQSISCTSAPHSKYNVDTSSIPNLQLLENIKTKYSTFSLDQRFHQIISTYLASAAIKPSTPTEDRQFCKLLRETFADMPKPELKEKIQSVIVKEDHSATGKHDSQQEQATTQALFSHSRRGFHNQPRTDQCESTPSQQFQPITIFSRTAFCEQNAIEPVDAESLNIPRNPVICPISTCQKPFFISDFTKHIFVDHSTVPRERICAQKCTNFFLDPKLISCGVNRCQAVLLLRDKIKNLGCEKFKDFITILVMSTKVNLLELCCSQYRAVSPEVQKSTQKLYLIWLTGLVPPKFPIFVTLTAWTRSGCKPFPHIVHSGRLYSIRESQIPDALYKSGQIMVLSENQVNLLTSNGKNMLELQVCVH